MFLVRVSSSQEASQTKVQLMFRTIFPVISGVMMTALFWSQAGLMLPVSVAKPVVVAAQPPGKFSWQNLWNALRQSFKSGKITRGSGSFCLIAPPQSKDAESVPLVWNPSPRFFWVGAFQDLEVLDREQVDVWKSSIPVKEAGEGQNQPGVMVPLATGTLPLQSVVFPSSQKLMPGGLYDLLLKSGQTGGVLVSFKTVSVEMADQISRDLAQQERELKAIQAKPEAVLQARAEYFLEKGLYLDSLQALYEAGQINAQYQKDLQSLVTEACKPES